MFRHRETKNKNKILALLVFCPTRHLCVKSLGSLNIPEAM